MPFDKSLIRQLESFGRVLSPQTLEEAPHIAFRREKEVENLQRHLDRARQKSFLVVGPSGCGKSVILRQLIQRISTRRNKPWLVLETSTTLMLKGTKYLGEWQTRFHHLMDLLARLPNTVVQFTDIPNLTGAGRHSESEENLASALVPYLESGQCIVFGELTEEQATGWLDRFPWFRNLFSLFHIAPLADAVAAEVIHEQAEWPADLHPQRPGSGGGQERGARTVARRVPPPGESDARGRQRSGRHGHPPLHTPSQSECQRLAHGGE